METELIPPNTLISQLQQRLMKLEEGLSELLKNQKNQPEGHLRVAQKLSARTQYYHYMTPTDLTGKYIRKKNIAFAKTLAQKDYDENIISLIQKEITSLEEYLLQTENGKSITDYYDRLCPARRTLITPVTLTEEQYTQQWKGVSWIGRPFAPDTPVHRTANGERVRSKSEIIIADTLLRHGIPYRYEFPLTLHCSADDNDFRSLDGTVTLHPDFLCLNTRTRQEFFWEHFGLMDDPEYAKKAACKLRLYTENGILPGSTLIITIETQTEPPSSKALENLITEFLK